MPEPTLTLPQLASLTGIEYRTLHTWLSRGLITASYNLVRGSGTQSVFSREDALTACVLADLRRSGLELGKLQKVAEELREPKAMNDQVEVLLINGVVRGASYSQLAKLVPEMSPALVYDVGQAATELNEKLEAGAL